MLNIELFEQLARTIIANGYHREQSNTYIIEKQYLKHLNITVDHTPNSGQKQIIYIRINSNYRTVSYSVVGDETVFLCFFYNYALTHKTISQQAIRKLMRRIYKVIC